MGPLWIDRTWFRAVGLALSMSALCCAVHSDQDIGEQHVGGPVLEHVPARDRAPRADLLRAREGRRKRPPGLVELTVRSDTRGSVSLDRGAGSFGEHRLEVGLSTGLPLAGGFLRPDMRWARSRYDASDAQLVGVGPLPFRRSEEFSFGTSYARDIGEGWSIYTLLRVGANREVGASLGNSMRVGALAAVRRRVTEDLELGLGVFARTQIEEDPLAFPVPSVEWNFAEDWKLRTNRRVELIWNAGAATRLQLAAGFERDRFRLRDDGAVPRGVAEIQRIPLELEFEYRISDRARVEVTLGTDFGSDLTIEDERGRELGSDSLGLPFRFGIQFGLRL